MAASKPKPYVTKHDGYRLEWTKGGRDWAEVNVFTENGDVAIVQLDYPTTPNLVIVGADALFWPEAVRLAQDAAAVNPRSEA